MQADYSVYEKTIAGLRAEGELIKYRLRLLELRYNPNHDPKTGRFCSGNGLTGGGSGGIIKLKGSVNSRFPTSQDMIDSLIESDMPNIKFTFKPVYNSRIRANGKTVIVEDRYTGKVKYIDSVQIGKQDKPSAEFLEDTIIHEELEARIAMRSLFSHKFSRLYHDCSDYERHKYINSRIERYFHMRGWWYDVD